MVTESFLEVTNYFIIIFQTQTILYLNSKGYYHIISFRDTDPNSLWVELYPSQRDVKVLTLRTPECDLIWDYDHYRYKDEFIQEQSALLVEYD